jgi:xanthine/CO dehydrogenase XdhC/CoxF family maturation factor
MLVTAEGRAFGTVGGRKIELRAIAEAQGLLADHGRRRRGSFRGASTMTSA